MQLNRWVRLTTFFKCRCQRMPLVLHVVHRTFSTHHLGCAQNCLIILCCTINSHASCVRACAVSALLPVKALCFNVVGHFDFTTCAYRGGTTAEPQHKNYRKHRLLWNEWTELWYPSARLVRCFLVLFCFSGSTPQ